MVKVVVLGLCLASGAALGGDRVLVSAVLVPRSFRACTIFSV